VRARRTRSRGHSLLARLRPRAALRPWLARRRVWLRERGRLLLGAVASALLGAAALAAFSVLHFGRGPEASAQTVTLLVAGNVRPAIVPLTEARPAQPTAAPAQPRAR